LNEELEPKGAKPLRYVAIRLRKRQGGLFADGSSVLHFAVLSNIWDWEPVKLIEWHREKAGTIERVHDVLKNELATGVLPSKYFGANAAWLRLAVISYKRADGPEAFGVTADLLRARPKRLRFLIFYTAGRLVHHPRQMRLRLARETEGIVLWLEALRFPTASDLTRTSVRELIDGFAEPLLDGSSENCCPMVYRSALHPPS